MPLDRRPEALHGRRINIVNQQHCVRVSHRNGGNFDHLTGDVQLIDVRLILCIKRQCAGLKTRRAHINHDLPVILDLELNQTTARNPPQAESGRSIPRRAETLQSIAHRCRTVQLHCHRC